MLNEYVRTLGMILVPPIEEGDEPDPDREESQLWAGWGLIVLCGIMVAISL